MDGHLVNPSINVYFSIVLGINLNIVEYKEFHILSTPYI